MRYAGALFLTLATGVFLVIVGLTGRTGVALAVFLDPHDVQDSDDS